MEDHIIGRVDPERSYGGLPFTTSHLSHLVMDGDTSLLSSRLELIHQMVMQGREASSTVQDGLNRDSTFTPALQSRTDTTRQRNTESQARQFSHELENLDWTFDRSNVTFNFARTPEHSSITDVADPRATNTLADITRASDFGLSSRVPPSQTSSHQGEFRLPL